MSCSCRWQTKACVETSFRARPSSGASGCSCRPIGWEQACLFFLDMNSRMGFMHHWDISTTFSRCIPDSDRREEKPRIGLHGSRAVFGQVVFSAPREAVREGLCGRLSRVKVRRMKRAVGVEGRWLLCRRRILFLASCRRRSRPRRRCRSRFRNRRTV